MTETELKLHLHFGTLRFERLGRLSAESCSLNGVIDIEMEDFLTVLDSFAFNDVGALQVLRCAIVLLSRVK